jgi:hypothetical protein
VRPNSLGWARIPRLVKGRVRWVEGDRGVHATLPSQDHRP